jgi:outer membrane cobalamin receptor
MKLIVTLSIICFTLTYSADDSTRVFRLNDVVITGTRTTVAIEKLPSSVQVLDSLELAQSNGTSLADKLMNIAGITLRSYGGNGSLHSVSVRGMGSDYALILVNGQRFTTFQISTVDVGIFSLNEVERIEIAGGGASSLYGADAVGGVINIITKKPTGKLFASFSQSIGSFGLNGYQATAGGGDERFSYRGSMELRRASNAFDFFFNNGNVKERLHRDGADYTLKNYSLNARTLLMEDIVTNYSLRYSAAERGQPAAVTNAVQNNLARIQDKDLFVSAATELKESEQIDISFPVSFHNNRQEYRDPHVVISGMPLSAHYENNIFNLTPAIRYSLTSDHRIVAGGDVAVASISSNELIPSKRLQLSGFFASQLRFFLPIEVIIFPSVRYDSFSDTDGDISPKVGINIGLLEEPIVRLRASYGKNYRIPTFNDLYWINGGNPHLHPERSLNADAGIIGGFQAPSVDASIELNYFSIAAKDKIVWQPGANGIWSPKNLQSVSSSGVELGFNLNMFDDLLMLNYSHNFLHSVKTSADFPNDDAQNKILPYVPQEFSNINIGSSYSGISLNVRYSFTGFRYESADNNPRYILPTYETVDANISYGFSMPAFTIRIKTEVNNLFNTQYQLVSGYPTPLRNFVFTTEFAF